MLIEIDPTVDFACKLLLGNPEYPDITIHFLNAILRLPAPIRVGRDRQSDRLEGVRGR